MFALVSLTLSDVDSSISCPCQIQSGLLVDLPTLIVGSLTDPSLCVVLTDGSPRLMYFGFWMKTALLAKFIPQRELRATIELSEKFRPTTLLKMGL